LPEAVLAYFLEKVGEHCTDTYGVLVTEVRHAQGIMNLYVENVYATPLR
jgi:hypothetical protein